MIKKKAAIVFFTSGGKNLAERIRNSFFEEFSKNSWELSVTDRPIPFGGWMKQNFQTLDLLIFIGAVGIVVRGMAPYLKDKKTDPAVVAMDEKGKFVISVLSGHLGGANFYAERLAEKLHAVPVITTASDVTGKIAIDVFAKENDLFITSMDQAKLCAARIVSGLPVSFHCSGCVTGKVPPELGASLEQADFHVLVSPHRQEEREDLLHLIPKAFVLGIGCKKGTGEEQIARRIEEELQKTGIDLRSIFSVATIDLKKEETGLLDYCQKRNLPLHFYSAQELMEAKGSFSSSSFVRGITGADNVCERAAFLEAGRNGKNASEQCFVTKKSGKDGVTVAIMKIDWSISFE